MPSAGSLSGLGTRLVGTFQVLISKLTGPAGGAYAPVSTSSSEFPSPGAHPVSSLCADGRLAAGVLAGFLLTSTAIMVSYPVYSRTPHATAGGGAAWDDAGEGVWTGAGVTPLDGQLIGTPWETPEGGAEGRRVRRGGGGQVVCWASWNHGGYGDAERGGSSSPSPPSLPSLPGGVMVYGRGCKRCVVGAVCSFLVSIQRPAHWVEGASPRQRELMVHLTGPALLVAGVKQMPPMDGSLFLVSYQLWDAGRYRISILSPCDTLNYTAQFRSIKGHEMAAWNSSVLLDEPVLSSSSSSSSSSPASASSALPSSSEKGLSGASTAQGTGLPQGSAASAVSLAASGEGVRAPGSTSALGVDYRPCASPFSLQARWLRSGAADYSWVPFPCAQTYGLHEWVPELNRRGIFEINFVGDSHQRTLMHHFLYLVSRRIDWPNRSSHSPLSYTVKPPLGGSLKLNMYFMKGIYNTEDDFQCGKADRSSSAMVFPNLSPTADVVVAESGYWTGTLCKKPEKAYAAHAPAFMLRLMNATSPESTGRASAPLRIYRATPPRSTADAGCSPMTNVYARFANELAQDLCPLAGFLFFDSWQIEGSRFLDHCPADHHYSCIRERFFTGIVGEADVKALVHFIMRHKPAVQNTA